MQRQMPEKPPLKPRSRPAKSDRKKPEPAAKRRMSAEPAHHDTLAGSGMEQDPTR